MANSEAGREAFANSVVDFLRTYQFNGVDIDWEYPSGTGQSGNPNDFAVAEPLRTVNYNNYVLLMKNSAKSSIWQVHKTIRNMT